MAHAAIDHRDKLSMKPKHDSLQLSLCIISSMIIFYFISIIFILIRAQRVNRK